jgi:Predicted glycosyl hydrolase
MSIIFLSFFCFLVDIKSIYANTSTLDGIATNTYTTDAYGYDWSSNGTKAYGISGIYNLASTYRAIIKWDSVSQSPYFTYTDASGISHTVWFENAQSLNYKLDLVNSYNLSGIAIWRLGLENADYWTNIKMKFNR